MSRLRGIKARFALPAHPGMTANDAGGSFHSASPVGIVPVPPMTLSQAVKLFFLFVTQLLPYL